MSDEIDQAQALSLDFQDFALELNRKRRERGVNTGFSCIDCGEEIPIKRRRAQPGCRRCISCQESFEIQSHWRAL